MELDNKVMIMNSTFFQQEILGNTVKSYIVFASVIMLGMLFKRIISKLISKLAFRLFEKFAADVKVDTFLNLLLRPIEMLITSMVAYTATLTLKYPFVLNILNFSETVDKQKVRVDMTIGQVTDKIFLLLIIVSIFWIILRGIDFIMHVMAYKASLSESKADGQLVPFLKELTKIIICIIGFFVILGAVFNVNVLTLIAGLGIGGIAIALAAKESLENLLSSFTIFLDKPFTVGDQIKVGGVEGAVEKVGFRSTLIRTGDKTLVCMPNRKMIDGPLENMTLRDHRRIKFIVGITYETAPDAIKNILADIKTFLDNHIKTSNDSVVTFDNFGDSALQLQVLYYVEMTEYAVYLKIKEEINFAIIEIVEKYKSGFAYPTRRVIYEKGPDSLPVN